MRPFHMWMADQVEQLSEDIPQENTISSEGKKLTVLDCELTIAFLRWCKDVHVVPSLNTQPDNAEQVYDMMTSCCNHGVRGLLGELAFDEWGLWSIDNNVSGMLWYTKWVKPHIRFDLV